jgi:AcrR family transcriptional regulator
VRAEVLKKRVREVSAKVKVIGQTREELIDAAWLLFGDRGYGATSIRDISDSAGVSRGAFYRYFHSKEQVLDAVAEHAARRAMDEMAPLRVDEKASAPERVDRFVAASRRWELAQLPLLTEAVRALLRAEEPDPSWRHGRSLAAGVWRASHPTTADPGGS